MERIILDGVGKRFKIGFKKNQSALARLASIFSGRETRKVIWALKDISFKVEEGEIAGLVGKNGSGKSTLLRCISRIYKKDRGKIKIRGKVVPIISLNVGLQPRLTMRDNIYLCCSLFGLSKKKVKEMFNDIVKFSELKDFLNTKLYQFSEGMKQRLAFSIAIHCNPKILLLDEVFEIGDKKFKIKSANKIKELVKRGAVVLLVSHEMWMIEKYCDKVIWLDGGVIVREGKTEDILREYKEK